MLTVDEQITRKAINLYGVKLQSVVAMEELNELGQQIAKQIRGKGQHDHLVEEMADVMICMFQLFTIYKVSGKELQEAIDLKLSRLEKRMENDYGQN